MRMRHYTPYYFLSLLLLFAAPAFSQQKAKFHISSFKESPLDLSAREAPTSRDDGTGELYAIIKVTSADPHDDLRAYSFDFGKLKHVPEMKDGELWLYVQYGAKNISIARKGYLPINRESLNTTLQPGRVYRMGLSAEQKQVSMQYLLFEVSPADCKAVIMYSPEDGDGERIFGHTDNEGCAAKKLPLGRYSYRIISENYHESTGVITLSATNGRHVEQVALQPCFARVTLETDADADIYINDQKKGTGTWSGILASGTYNVECRKERHKSCFETITIEEGKDVARRLASPAPITGMLSLESSPHRARITIDGKVYGDTPSVIEGLLIGNHKVTVSKDGYLPQELEVVITENEVFERSVTLQRGGEDSRSANNPMNSLDPAVQEANSVKPEVAAAPVRYDRKGKKIIYSTRQVSGTVTDRKGYPLEGAKVYGKGGALMATAKADGTFSFNTTEQVKSITVEKEGYLKRKKKIKEEDMLFRMRKGMWFVSGCINQPIGAIESAGLIFGRISNWGWYTKIIGWPTITAGFTKRLLNPLYLYSGAGFALFSSDNYYNDYYEEIPAFALDLGIIYTPFRYFNLLLGIQPCLSAECCIGLHLGIGFQF